MEKLKLSNLKHFYLHILHIFSALDILCTSVRGGKRGEHRCAGWGGRGGGQLSEVSGSPGVLQLCVLNVFTLISFLPPFCPPRSFSSCTSPTTCCIPSSVSLVSITLHFCHHFFWNALGWEKFQWLHFFWIPASTFQSQLFRQNREIGRLERCCQKGGFWWICP